jgi:branched-chain amino acid transport system permease protein
VSARDGRRRGRADAWALGGAALAALPLVTARADVLTLGVLFLLSLALAQSWNVVGGYAGQVNLGHAAFFGIGCLATRALWMGGTPVVLAMAAGAALAGLAGVAVGAAAFRLRGAYFAIATLALAEILRITVGNTMPEISTLPAATIASYDLGRRYYAALALAAGATAAVAAVARSRLGLGMQAVREDEAAAAASGVSVLGVKLAAVAVSTALAGLTGGVFAYYHISFYPQHPFSPAWTFDAVLITFIGGVGTLHGPVLGAAFYVVLKEYLALRWVDAHLLIFGALFVAIVLLLPGGLAELGRRATGRAGAAR